MNLSDNCSVAVLWMFVQTAVCLSNDFLCVAWKFAFLKQNWVQRKGQQTLTCHSVSFSTEKINHGKQRISVRRAFTSTSKRMSINQGKGNISQCRENERWINDCRECGWSDCKVVTLQSLFRGHFQSLNAFHLWKFKPIPTRCCRQLKTELLAHGVPTKTIERIPSGFRLLKWF